MCTLSIITHALDIKDAAVYARFACTVTIAPRVQYFSAFHYNSNTQTRSTFYVQVEGVVKNFLKPLSQQLRLLNYLWCMYMYTNAVEAISFFCLFHCSVVIYACQFHVHASAHVEKQITTYTVLL